MNRSRPSTDADPQARAILDAVRHIVRALRVSASKSEQQLGLSAAQLFVLHRLRDGEGLSLRDLADRTLTDPSSVSVVVSRLVEKGLVTRVRAVNDARRVAVTLTAEGKRAVRRGPDPAQNRFLAAIAALTPRKRKALAALLGEVVGHMGLGGAAALFFEDEASVARTRGVRDAR